MNGPAAGEKRVALAAVAGAHGIRGEVRLKLFAEGLESLKRLQSVTLGGHEHKLVSVRAGGKFVVARLEGIVDRGAAEALRGELIEVARNQLPPLKEGEYYFSDLVGLPVVTSEGEAVGTIVAVENFGASDVIEIEKPDTKRFMVPLTSQAVPEWNEERLVVSTDFVEE